MSFWSDKTVLVTGGTGFLGRHITQALEAIQPRKLVSLGSKDYNLVKETEVEAMYAEHSPEIVFHLAGLVGGILPNRERPADYFYNNLMMGTLVLHHASRSGVKKVISAGAGCGYPELTTLPLKESSFWDGFPQKESAPYSLAKRMLQIQGKAYHSQYGLQAVTCVPGNVYGEYDNFNLHDSHVVPALVRKFVEASQKGLESVEVWGDGTPTRDYVYAGDVAQGMIKAAEVYKTAEVVNLSSGRESSVTDICKILKDHTQFKGEIKWNTDRPSGQKRRWFDVSKAKADLGFACETSLSEGLKKTTDWYLRNMDSPTLRR